MKTIYFIAVFILLSLAAFAQDNENQINNFPISLGPQFAGKMGVSVVQPQMGRQNGISFSNLPDAGINAYIPVNDNAELGILLDIGLNNYAFSIKDFNTNNKYAHQISYFSFSPSIYFNGFLFGFGFGFVLSANQDGNDIKTDDLNALTEFNLGYIYPISSDETGRLNVFIKASYQLSKTFNDFPKVDPLKNKIIPDLSYPATNAHNPRVASVSIGFNYLFNL